MIKNNYYTINNKFNKVIAVFSDLHYFDKFDDKLFLEIINNLKTNKPDYICIAGDIVDDSKYLDVEILRNRLKNFLKFLGAIAPTFIVQGNHDQMTAKNLSHKKYIKEEYYLNLNLDNVYYLGNSNKIIDDINFIGFNPDYSYYEELPHEDKKTLLEELKKIKKLILKDKYNIVLFHSPITITNKYVIDNFDNFKDINLIITGHMHNGLVPSYFDKYKNNRGLIDPHNVLLPPISRGIKKVNNTDLFMSGGISKLPRRIYIKLKKLHYKETSHIEYLKI